MVDTLATPQESGKLLWLKRWIWFYFWLLIFEGALRKWFLRPLNGPLLIVRDPVVLIIYYQAYRCGKFNAKTMWPFALLSLLIVPLAIMQIVTGIESIWIALYGLRSYLLHLPLVVVMAETLTAKDIRRFGRWLLLLAVPMGALIIAQYYAPASSWLNAGAGERAGQIVSAGGHIRPAATFSYGIGAQLYVILAGIFLLDAVAQKRLYPLWLLASAALAITVSTPALGSRTVIFTFAAMAIFMFIAGMNSVASLSRLVRLSVFLLALALLVTRLPFFADASATLGTRFSQASESEGSTEDVMQLRIVGVFERGFESAGVTSWIGNGIGMGSNFAAVLTTGNRSFLLGETEWERIVLEFGPIFGLMFLGVRVFAAIYIVVQASRALRRNNLLPWLLLPFVAPALVLYNFEMPTNLGFIVFGAGVCLAAAQKQTPAPATWRLQGQ